MQRKIKFRAWWIEKKIMLHNVHLFYDQLDERLHGNEYEPEQNFGNILDNPKYIVQQYTGLDDKNNKEIYEGDILRGNRKEKPLIVVWKKNEFCLKDEWNKFSANILATHYWEVIGNIYQSPELLNNDN